MLRGGFHALEVARCLDTTTGTHAVWFNERLLTSPEQAVAECVMIMHRRMTNKPDSGRAIVKSETLQPTLLLGKQCPECHGSMRRQGGCDVCSICNFSKCF